MALRYKGKILVLDSGARGHSWTWKIGQSPLATGVECAPGNGGTGANYNLSEKDIPGMVKFARKNGFGLVMPCSEAWLEAGAVDQLHAEGILAFGPMQAAARLESSKIFTRELCKRKSIPSPRWAWSEDATSIRNIIRMWDSIPVLKADGLCQGKGVVVPGSIEEALAAVDDLKRQFKESASRILIEEMLVGWELSLMVFTDGVNAYPMPVAQDYKRALDGDRGPNTGGMGAYSPVPRVSDKLIARIMMDIIMPALQDMREHGTPFRGVLYAGIMVTKDGPKLIEFNVRPGDPESQVALMRIKSDIVPYMLACMEDDGLAALPQLDIHPYAAVSTVLAAAGYPGDYERDKEITGTDNLPPEIVLFHAGTKLVDGKLYTNGGRVMNVVSRAETLEEARELSQRGAEAVQFEGKRYRSDIAEGVMKQL